MTDIEPEEDLPPVAHVTIVYTGPIAPHWDLRVRYGDQKLVDDFWARVNARLLLLPKHDPQFRRNKERVNRDAERERIICDWDLGEDDAETTITPVETPVSEADAGEQPEAAAQAEADVVVEGDATATQGDAEAVTVDADAESAEVEGEAVVEGDADGADPEADTTEAESTSVEV